MQLLVVKWAGKVISGAASSLTCKMPAVNSHKNMMTFGLVFFLTKVMFKFLLELGSPCWADNSFLMVSVEPGEMDKRSLWYKCHGTVPVRKNYLFLKSSQTNKGGGKITWEILQTSSLPRPENPVCRIEPDVKWLKGLLDH